MRFNPPPNWPPAPPGWTPPPDWRPDPSWPPLPPGWPLWVPDATRSKTGLIIGAIAATLLIGIGAVVAVVVVNKASTVPGTPTTTVEAAKSDEDLVREVVDQFEQAWNDEDFTALTGLFCEDMRNDPDFSRSALREVRDTGGELLLKIASLDVDGKTATATILNHGEDPDDIAFVREDGDWKWCES
jgi:hypothetical protein